MSVTLTITGNTGPEAVQELFTYLGSLQRDLNNAAAKAQALVNTNPTVSTPETAGDAPSVAEAPKKESKKKAAEKLAEKAAEVESKLTLQEVMDLTKKAILDSGDEAKGRLVVEKINEKFGIKKVRELPVDKLDGYAEAVRKELPSKETAEASGASMFD